MRRGPENYLFSAQQNITKNVPYKVISKLYQGHTLLYCDTLNELWFPTYDFMYYFILLSNCIGKKHLNSRVACLQFPPDFLVISQ